MDLQGALGRGHLKLGVGGKKEPAGEPAFCQEAAGTGLELRNCERPVMLG